MIHTEGVMVAHPGDRAVALAAGTVVLAAENVVVEELSKKKPIDVLEA